MHVLSFLFGSLTGTVSLPWLTTSEIWLILLVLAISLQAIICYALWRMFRRRKGSVRTDVLHSVIHELQTPIASIRMAVDVIDSPVARNQPVRTDKYIRIIREETERLQHQVETMLTLAQADQNTLTLNMEPVSLSSLLEAIAERHGHYLRLSLQTDANLMADRLHLTNVLHNLVDNAVKYSVGEPIVSVRLTTATTGLTLLISDQGIGIPAQHLRQIFKPFFRVHDHSQPSVKGFGLGLSYVQQIVLAHKWRIDVTSEPGKGSEFKISIPPVSILTPVGSSTEAS